MLITNANAKYTKIGEPTVMKDKYMKNSLMLVVAMPSFSPKRVQTPNAYCSKKLCKRFIEIYVPLQI